MFQWLIIGLVIWYFYKRYTNRKGIGSRNNGRYIRDDDFNSRPERQSHRMADEDDYIDYEEVK